MSTQNWRRLLLLDLQGAILAWHNTTTLSCVICLDLKHSLPAVKSSYASSTSLKNELVIIWPSWLWAGQPASAGSLSELGAGLNWSTSFQLFQNLAWIVFLSRAWNEWSALVDLTRWIMPDFGWFMEWRHTAGCLTNVEFNVVSLSPPFCPHTHKLWIHKVELWGSEMVQNTILNIQYI